MENFKTKKIFTFLFMLTIFFTLTLGNVFAGDIIFNLTGTYNGKTLTNGTTIEVGSSSSKTINISINPTYTKNLKIGYIWDADARQIASENSKTATITIPNFAEGTSHVLQVEALINDFDDNYIGNSNVLTITVKVPAKTTVDVNLKNGNTTLSEGATVEKSAGDTLTIVTSSNRTVKQIAYRWNSENLEVINGSTATIKVPNYAEGSSNKLKIQAMADDETYSLGKAYTVKIAKTIPLTGDITAKYNNNTLSSNSTTTISEGAEVVITCSPSENFTSISGTWQINNNTPSNVSFSGASTSLDIPGVKGQTIKLTLTGILKDGGKTATKVYTFKIPADAEEPLTGDISAKNGGTTLKEGSTNEMPVGTQLTLVGSPAENIKKITYKWDNGTSKDISGSNGKIEVPDFDAGSEHKLIITATLTDGTVVSQKVYKIKIPTTATEPDEEKLTGSVVVEMNGKSLSNNSANTVVGDEVLELLGEPSRNFSALSYRWDDESEIEVSGSSTTISVLAEEGYTHRLKVYGILKDGGKTSTKTYNFVVEENDELVIENWMREDPDAEGLLVSLRNDSEEKKANKNFYEIDEEVIYYVDYKNCGKDIKNEVKIVLELPLKFKVVNSAGGVTSNSDKTITWTFPNGLEEEQAGTKEVVLKYTELSKKSYDYEIVYPAAAIYEKTKKKDSSAVINYIYLSESTVIEDEHEPYMFGDEGTKTFRPDATISRAEGALVLTRIFGIKTSNIKVTNIYPDLSETYLEAQKAIIAASNLGIINGFPDGTYRPNEKMTRAEFMKIIASYVEILGEEKDVEGLEVKEDSTIKVYKYSANKDHWAIDYATLLVRLNMTPVSNSNKNLRLDDGITRAEVAQLVNFYLLRAPAKVSSSTTIGFVDVSRNHELIEDIVEATRAEHKYVITSDGKERAK